MADYARIFFIHEGMRAELNTLGGHLSGKANWFFGSHLAKAGGEMTGMPGASEVCSEFDVEPLAMITPVLQGTYWTISPS